MFTEKKQREMKQMYSHTTFWCFPGGVSGKELSSQCGRLRRCGFNPLVRKIPWRRAWQLTAVFLPGESHGQRSLVGYSPYGHRVGHDLSDLAYTHHIHELKDSKVLSVFSKLVYGFNKDQSVFQLLLLVGDYKLMKLKDAYPLEEKL